MSLGFNLNSSKKEDVSARLKVHNLKRAKNETKRLETEGKKMEERLVELKMAMNREKEEREKHGGGFWKKGQQGTLNNYAEEVLTKKKSKSASKQKIKVLKDKPLDLPERSNQPGTVAFIAQRGSHTPRDKPRGPRCGQCEERKAAVSCQQCAEDYCAGCFAAFHLKGNLKKHRSVPLMATPRQCFASPRPSQSTTSSYDFEQGDGAMMSQSIYSARKKDRNSPEGASGMVENNLMDGEYNEAEQAAAFQSALEAWRLGKAASNGDPSGPDWRGHEDQTPRGYSPVQTPTVNVDSGVGTINKPVEIDITFNTNTISYADRLLLKKHRRTDVETLFTPRGDTGSQPQTPRYETRGFAREGSMASIKIEEFNDDDFNREERVDFQALYDTVKDTESEPPKVPRPESVVSIVEVQESQSEQGLEHVGKYMVAEEGGMDHWATDLQQSSPTKPMPPKSGKSSRRKSGRKSSRSSLDNNGEMTESVSASIPSLISREKTTNDINSILNSRLLGAKLNDVENEIKQSEHKPSTVPSRKGVNAHATKPVQAVGLPPKSASKQRQVQQDVRPANEVPTTSAKSSAAKSRPQSGRAKSRQEQQAPSRPGTSKGSRPPSSKGSRPPSRTNSRMGSRAASRAENPGLLTKAPSEALQSIARMTPTGDTYQGIDSFFMVGVQPGEQVERTLTPTQHKTNNKDEKIKVSYQLYNMAPRSWKPDFSLADTVPTDKMENDEAEEDRASSVMAYQAYSEQVMSDMTERLISRFDELPMDEDSLSDRSSGSAYRSLGEEFRTFTPRCSSVHNSPTPVPSANQGVQREPSNLSKVSAQQVHAQKSARQPAQPSPRPSARNMSQTPRQSAVYQSQNRSQTPQTSKSRLGIQTPRRSRTCHDELERPISRAIVMEGTDLSIYDNMGESEKRNEEDEETLDQLEFELASESGRLTAEGTISRMEMPENLSDDSLNNSLDSYRSLSRLGHDHGYDINSKLMKDELEEDDEATDDETDVRNLM